MSVDNFAWFHDHLRDSGKATELDSDASERERASSVRPKRTLLSDHLVNLMSTRNFVDEKSMSGDARISQQA